MVEQGKGTERPALIFSKGGVESFSKEGAFE